MRILLDENVDNRIREVLESKDFEVKTTFQLDLSGRSDVEIIKYAVKNDLAILTHDDDFLSLKDRMEVD